MAAPMAGGPSTPELVVAAAQAGGLGFLAGGYKTAAELSRQIDAVRTETAGFGVNLFVPNPVPVDRAAYEAYRAALDDEAVRYGVDLPGSPREDDDAWRDKIDVLLECPPPVVSFTFGIPDRAALDALRRAGCTTVQTVTSVDEARRAEGAGVDALAVQGAVAGGHSGTMTPHRPVADRPLTDLVVEIDAAVGLPIIAVGGVHRPGAVVS
ncbi:MAG: nitronate monooxygenase, partial [Jatrophihabitans endophyticus]|nr:nitronate monooxygenase [Jatrophihabitans endophyticus]